VKIAALSIRDWYCWWDRRTMWKHQLWWLLRQIL